MNQGKSSPLDRIPVFFCKAMVADAESFSPSAAKPEAALQSWQQLGVALTIIEPTPATRDDFVRAHDSDFVDGVLARRVRNGFGNKSAAVAASLPYTTGAMLSAARKAIRNRCVAAAPCSGFHHAAYSQPAGFCTFNGLMVAAMALHASGEAARVGILDFDHHYGDGTDHIIARHGIDWITHYTAGRFHSLPADAPAFLSEIAGHVEAMRDCDVILYQAGADPHVDDPLGGWLTTEQLCERDRRVFRAAHALGVPIVWNLAGGYQTPLRKVLAVHDNTMRACADEYLGSR